MYFATAISQRQEIFRCVNTRKCPLYFSFFPTALWEKKIDTTHRRLKNATFQSTECWFIHHIDSFEIKIIKHMSPEWRTLFLQNWMHEKGLFLRLCNPNVLTTIFYAFSSNFLFFGIIFFKWFKIKKETQGNKGAENIPKKSIFSFEDFIVNYAWGIFKDSNLKQMYYYFLLDLCDCSVEHLLREVLALEWWAKVNKLKRN